MGDDQFSEAWCQPIGLVQVVGIEWEFGSAALKRDGK